MKRTIVIIGAGGHGRVVRDIALSVGYEKVFFLDDSEKLNVEVKGKAKEYVNYINDCDFFVAIGNNTVREKIMRMIVSNEGELATLVHPSVIVGGNVKIGRGTVVVAGAVINNGARIGEGVIINTCSSVDHDDIIGNFCHISVGAHLSGTVCVGQRSFIGAGATISNNISVCEDCIIGAGAAVVKDITEKGTYIGVPARKV